jgi:hypothetical protein
MNESRGFLTRVTRSCEETGNGFWALKQGRVASQNTLEFICQKGLYSVFVCDRCRYGYGFGYRS